MVIRGVDKHTRRIFKMWEESAGPCAIFEITSKSTKNEDLKEKKNLYASLNVGEYFLFDPIREYLKGGFMGFRLKRGVYAPLPLDSEGRMFSRELGVFLMHEGNLLRVIDPKTGLAIPAFGEAIEGFEAEKKRADEISDKYEKLKAMLIKMGIEPEE